MLCTLCNVKMPFVMSIQAMNAMQSIFLFLSTDFESFFIFFYLHSVTLIFYFYVHTLTLKHHQYKQNLMQSIFLFLSTDCESFIFSFIYILFLFFLAILAVLFFSRDGQFCFLFFVKYMWLSTTCCQIELFFTELTVSRYKIFKNI